MKAFVFPGQGSQKVGMGLDLIEKYEIAKKRYAEVDEILGFSLSKVAFEGPSDELTKTENAQPAILAYSVIAGELLAEKGIEAGMMAGHSLGEFSALVVSEMLSFEDGLRVVRKRGQIQAAADPDGKGGMAAVLGLDDDVVKEVCEEISKTAYVVPVNFNTPGQVVISGLKEGIAQAVDKMKAAGAKRVLPLKVAGAFHSKLMEEASKEFAEFLEGVSFNAPKVPVISNVTALPEDEKNIKELLVRQIKEPVLWVDSVNYMKKQGVDEVVEVGFGAVVSGMVRKIDSSLNVQGCKTLLEL